MIQIKHKYVKIHGGMEVNIRAFCSSTLDGGEGAASRSGSFSSVEKVYDWTRGWLCSETGLVLYLIASH
jgi:hypothetical protein